MGEREREICERKRAHGEQLCLIELSNHSMSCEMHFRGQDQRLGPRRSWRKAKCCDTRIVGTARCPISSAPGKSMSKSKAQKNQLKNKKKINKRRQERKTTKCMRKPRRLQRRARLLDWEIPSKHAYFRALSRAAVLLLEPTIWPKLEWTEALWRKWIWKSSVKYILLLVIDVCIDNVVWLIDNMK